MPRSVEIDYYSQLLASLTITATRAKTEATLREVHDQLAEAYSEMFTLLSHDAQPRELLHPLLEPPS